MAAMAARAFRHGGRRLPAAAGIGSAAGGIRRSHPPPVAAASRLLSTAASPPTDDNEAEWEAAFIRATEHIPVESHAASAAAMRELVKTGLLRHTDLRDRPHRFFKAHRLLARHAVAAGPGFWIRFTVHYNLCFGTVLAVGGPEQVAALDDAQTRGLLGCFALTEKLAGVQSGLLVQTTAEFDAAKDCFVLNSPTAGSQKNWISQGFTADKAVVLAQLLVDGQPKGPHAFLMDLRRDGRLVEGVSVGDMGLKTTGNDLDNAWINFDRVSVPRSALLDAHAEVDGAGVYRVRTPGIKPFEMIGQRLYTGRVAVAQAALSYRRELFAVTKAYADAKPIWTATSSVKDPPRRLSSVPQLRSLFEEAETEAARLEEFVRRCEESLTPLLKSGAVPNDELAHAIATAKVKAVEASIDLCWRLKQEVGSYALMGDSGFAHLDFLNCCKFAEGDSRVLMQKMARDRMRRFGADAAAKASVPRGQEAEHALCAELAAALAAAKGDKAMQAQVWDREWRKVYEIAEAMMARTMDEVLAAPA